MSSFDSQRQESSLKRATTNQYSTIAPPNFHNYKLAPTTNPVPPFITSSKTLQPAAFSGGFDGGLVADSVVPPVTVVLEGRSICQRISLDKHGSYRSLALALRQMFVDINNDDGNIVSSSDDDVYNVNESNISLDLSNAVPGYLVAYEDIENDLLLVGDLNWKDFVRVAKRIRILPAKAKSRKKKEDN